MKTELDIFHVRLCHSFLFLLCPPLIHVLYFFSIWFVDVKVAASQEAAATRGTAVEVVIIAVIASIIFSLVTGFIIGYKFQSCRRYRDDVFYDRNCSSLQRGRNRLSSGDNPHFHTDHVGLTPKQINVAMNRKGNLVETKPVTKSNKVYL